MSTDELMHYLDVEDAVQAWIKTTAVNDLVGGRIFQAMPAGSELLKNVLILSRVGGAPGGTRGLISEDHGRISFSVYGENRRKAKEIGKELVRQIELLGVAGGYTTEAGYLVSAITLSWVWLPDLNVARYIIDGEFVAVGGIPVST